MNTEADNFKIIEVKKKINDVAKDYPVFISYYTIDNGYKEEAERLIRSLEKFKLPYYCEGILSGGKDWDEITKRKPILILKVLNMLPDRDVVWIDADAVILKLPTDLFDLEVDFACCYKNKRKLHSALLFFKNNNIARNICEDWIQENKKKQKYRTGDQKHLENIIDRTSSYHTHVLPNSYIKTCSNEEHIHSDGVIGQFYASNRLKNIHLNVYQRAFLNYRLRPAWLRSWVQKWFMKLTRYKLSVPHFLQ